MSDSGERVKITAIESGISIELDCTVKDAPKYAVDVTEHAVEGGSNVTDHARPKLLVLGLEGIVAETGAGDPVAAEAFLGSLWESPQVVKIETPRRDYPAMLLVTGEPQRSAKVGNAFHFSAEFKEYKTVATRLIVVEVRLGKKKKQGAKPPVNVKSPNLGSVAVQGAIKAGFVAPLSGQPSIDSTARTDAAVRAAEGP